MNGKYVWIGISILIITATLAACSSGGGGGGGGGSSAANVPRFAYVTNIGDNTISIYTVNANTGLLRHNGYMTTATSPNMITVDPSGKYAYVVNAGINTVSTYSINASSGALTSVGAAVATESYPNSVKVDPSGKYAYVANQNSNSISAYTINADSGALASIGTAVAAGTSPRTVTVDPTGKFIFTANAGSSNVSVYAINAATGALVPVAGSPFAAGTSPLSVAVDPSGKFAFVANRNSNDLSAYTINAGTGVLTQVICSGGALVCNGSNFIAGTSPYSVTVDPSGKFVYAANNVSNNVSAYTIDTVTGALTNVGSVAAGTNPVSVIVDPSGKFAYAANFTSNNVSFYSINNSTGMLTDMGTINGRANLASIAMTKGTAAVTYTPKFAYVANFDSDDISAYSIDAGTGVLTRILCDDGAGCNVNNFQSGINPAAIAVEPSGRFAYVANQLGNSVSGYSIDASTGKLTSLGAATPAGSGSRSVTVSPSGKFAYVANYNSDNVSVYSIDSSTGVLTLIDADGATAGIQSAITAGNGPNSITIDPAGRFAYVASYFSNAISAFSINADTGALTALNFVDPAIAIIGGLVPFSVTVDPTGKFVYVANYSSNDVTAYNINNTTGLLTPLTDVDAITVGNQLSIATGSNPRSVTLDPSGKFAYVANWFSNNLTAFTVDTMTGALTNTGNTVPVSGSAPRSVTVDPSGKFAYVANSSNDNISAYTINATSGILTSTGAAVASGNAPHAVTVTGTFQ